MDTLFGQPEGVFPFDTMPQACPSNPTFYPICGSFSPNMA